MHYTLRIVVIQFFAWKEVVTSGSGFAGFNIEGNSQLTISYDDGAPFVIGTASNPSTQAGFTNHFKIDSDGTLTATDTSIGSISDERLKEKYC